jgi:ATP-dependent Zn protease
MKKLIFTAILVVVALLIGWIIFQSRSMPATISYTQFIERVQSGQVDAVKIASGQWGSSRATLHLKSGETRSTVLPPDYSTALATLQEKLVNVEIQDAWSNPYQMLGNASPFLVLVAVWVILMARLRPWRNS